VTYKKVSKNFFDTTINKEILSFFVAYYMGQIVFQELRVI